MATSEQLEREAETARAQIAATLDELRGRLTAGQVVDQIIDYTRDSGGGEFFRNFGRQVAGNPLPITLVGAGLAWLMMAGRRGPARDSGWTSRFGADDVAERMSEAGDGRAPVAGESPRDSARQAAEQASANVADLSEHAVRRSHEWARQARATAAQVNARVGEAGAGLADTANEAGATVRDAGSAAYEAAAERSRQGADAIARGARTMRESAAASGQNVLGFLQEQPLVLAGIGLALGAVLGAALPSTTAEDRLMGDASDAAKRDAKAFADEQVEKGKAVAEQAWAAAKPEIDEQLFADAAPSGGEPDARATLVPSDAAETASDGARHDTGHRSE